jgi:transposase
MPRGTQVIRGTEYVYEYDSTWNAEKHYASHTRTYIGKMVNGVFVPNKRFAMQSSCTDPLRNPPGPVPVTHSSRAFYGATYLFDTLGAQRGIQEDLEACFPDTWKQILSIAYFLILEDRNPLSRFPRWAATHRHPYGSSLSSQRSSELFASIGEDSRQRFFQKQVSRRLEHEYLAYDTTSISSYSKALKKVKYGVNKDHDPLPQINLALLYGQSSGLPVCYRSLPGNISDVSTIQKLLTDIHFLACEKVSLVMDRGFYSEDNVNALYRHHYKFLIGAKLSLKLVQAELEKVRSHLHGRDTYDPCLRLNAHSSTIVWPYREMKVRQGTLETGERRMYLHLYFNDQKAVDDKAELNHLLDTLEEELKAGKAQSRERAMLAAKYFTVTRTPVRGVTVTPNQEAIDEAQKNYGYFALMTNDIKDPIKALEIYRGKDVIEKAFGNLKERLNMRRTSVSSEENFEGKLFVEFVALMFVSALMKLMHEQKLFKDYTFHEVLDELDVIEYFEHPGHRGCVGEMTKKQSELFSKLGVPVPA